MARVAIVGAGPIGLEAALAAVQHGADVTVFERAPTAAGHVRRWGHVRLFTPWDMTVSPRMRAVLGERAPAGSALPTGGELADELLEPVAACAALRGCVRNRTTVVAIAREGLLKQEEIGSDARARRPFRLLVRSHLGDESIEQADVVIDASGTYGNPNRLGDGGIDAVNERAFENRITRTLQPLGPMAGSTILLTGSGHSAQHAARELAEMARHAPDTRVLWALRRAEADFGAVPGDPLPERAALNRVAAEIAAGASESVRVLPGRVAESLEGTPGGRVRVTLRNGADDAVEVDHIVALNGGQPDATLYRQLQVHECYASLGPMNLSAALLGSESGDCLAQGPHGAHTLRNPEPGFFILGAKSYGRNSEFLLRVGWQQVDDVFGELL